jgi:chromosome segregation ATPase
VPCQGFTLNQFQPETTGASADLTLVPADYQALLEELTLFQALDHDRVARIHQLEQALDEALVCLEEVRLQLKNQETLEFQLAATEEFSHVQQQAIARLKLQLAEQQQTIDTQLLETQQRDQAIQELMATIETMTQAQQRELERLRSYITQDQVEGKNHRNILEQQIQDLQTGLESRQHRISELESETLSARALTTSLREQLTTAQQQIKELSVRLQQHQADWTQLEAQLAEAQSERSHPLPAKGLIPLSRSWSTSEPGTALISLQQDVSRSHRRIETLENQLAQQARLQTRWQQGHQQLEEERDRLQTRVTTLEYQAAEMQEQILHQAQQATEYETAVQYWRDRHTTSQRQMTHLRERVEQALSQAGNDREESILSELLDTLLKAAPSAGKEKEAAPTPLPLPRFHTPELPDFLVRRRGRSMS